MPITDDTQQALALFEPSEYLAHARLVAFQLFNRTRRAVTVDDVREICPPPAGVDSRIMGAIFNTKDWKPAGYTQSKRRECHGRVIRQFVRVVPR